MPIETQDAVEWALQQDGVVSGEHLDRHMLVDAVRQYFNENNIEYDTFSAADLDPYLPPELH